MEHTKEDRQHSEDSIESLKEHITILESKLAYFEEKRKIWGEVLEEGLFIHEDFIITKANSAFSRITGYPNKELIGMHGKELLTDNSFEVMKKYALSNKDSAIELEMIAKNGKSKYLHTKGKTFIAGDRTQRAVIVQDITDIKEAQKRLKDSEQKYKSLVDNVDIGIGISKGEKILFANTSLLSIYGLKTIEELASKKLTDYMPSPSKKLVKERIRKYKLKEKQDNVFRHDIIRSDGEIRTLELITSEVIYEGEKCRQVLMKDITKEMENEAALKQAANIFNNTQLGLFIYRLDNLKDDRSLRMVAVNPASIQLVGLTADEMVGKTIDEIFPNLRKKRIPQQYAEVIRNQIPIAFDDIYYEDDRVSPNFFSVKVFPLPNQCVGISFENVSERRKTEQELRDRNQELNDFVYKVSHDLKAPLNSIQGLINLSKIEEKTNEYTPKIEERIDYLNGFIRDILSHSRNLNVAIIIEKIDLDKMINDWMSELDHIPNSQLIKKDVEISGLDLYSDKTRLSEIVRNLVSNAIKYHDLSKDNMFLRVKGEVNKNFVRITFEDNGIGIKSEFIDRIYNMFYRATDFAEGTGIGLYIVKEALGKLNGNIEVSSQHGHGTTFTIEIPNMISQK